MSKNYGVINEQGFVAGNNLGFNPLSESDKNALDQKQKATDDKDQKSNEKNSK